MGWSAPCVDPSRKKNHRQTRRVGAYVHAKKAENAQIWHHPVKKNIKFGTQFFILVQINKKGCKIGTGIFCALLVALARAANAPRALAQRRFPQLLRTRKGGNKIRRGSHRWSLRPQSIGSVGAPAEWAAEAATPCNGMKERRARCLQRAQGLLQASVASEH